MVYAFYLPNNDDRDGMINGLRRKTPRTKERETEINVEELMPQEN